MGCNKDRSYSEKVVCFISPLAVLNVHQVLFAANGVDMRIMHPFDAPLRRNFLPALKVEYSVSTRQKTYRVQINKIQVCFTLNKAIQHQSHYTNMSSNHVIRATTESRSAQFNNCDSLIHSNYGQWTWKCPRLLLRSKISCLEPSSHLYSTPSNLPNQSAWTQVSRSTALRPIHSKANAKWLFYSILFICV